MADPRDDLDAWMNAQVQPLPPPPGTFELIRKRARRRKMTRAAVAAAGAAAVIAVIAVVPRLVITQLQLGPSSSRGAAAGQTSSAGPARSHASTAPATPSAAGSGSPPATALPPAPPNFAATSVTFVGTETGYVLGQAGTPGQCQGPNPDICTSLAGTGDGGRSWHGVSAPVTGAPDGAAGVSQLRFYDTADGWAFGPGLWATHDGGHTWSQVSTGGLRVLALETAGQRVFAVWARCTGTGSAWAAGCTSAGLYSAAPGSDQWSAVPGAGTLSGPGGTSSAALVLAGSRGYLLAPDGLLYRGPAGSAGAWQQVTSSTGSSTGGSPSATASPGATAGAAPCAPGSAQADGQPSAALLGATTADGLVLVCPGTASGGSQPKAVYTSADGGQTWRQAGSAPAAGTATSVAGTTAGTIVLATTDGIEVSQDGGATWAAAHGPLPASGLRYVGMTTPDQGVAVPADAGLHAVWFTRDGGMTWQESAIP